MPTIVLPDFWKMPQFKHVEFVSGSFRLPDPPSDERDSDDVVIMENLHTLKGVSNFKCCEEVIKRIPNIKKLKVYYHFCTEGDGDKYFVENIQSLCRLKSLSILSLNSYVQSYKLSFPHSLKKLSLWMTDEFECEDYMLEKIGSLPLLEKLRLGYWWFGKGEWETVEGQFPSLKYLKLIYCRSLKNWTTAKEGSNIFPRLENLDIYYLDELKKIPHELGNIDTLKSIELFKCGEGAVKSLKEMVDEQIESQGEEQLSFHVKVKLRPRDKHLLSLASSKFEVTSFYRL